MANATHSLYVCKSEICIVIIMIYVDDLFVRGGDTNAAKVEHVKVSSNRNLR